MIKPVAVNTRNDKRLIGVLVLVLVREAQKSAYTFFVLEKEENTDIEEEPVSPTVHLSYSRMDRLQRWSATLRFSFVVGAIVFDDVFLVKCCGETPTSSHHVHNRTPGEGAQRIETGRFA